MKKTPAKWVPTAGDRVEVMFADHTRGKAEHSQGHLEFICWGRIAKVTRRAYIIHIWTYAEPEKYDDEDVSNIEVVSIVRKAIIHITKMTGAMR